MASKPSIGGQAVMEGVMMRGPATWAVAVRKPDSTIAVQTFDLPDTQERRKWLKWPFIRGVYVLGESLAIGMKALRISANYALEDEKQEELPKSAEKAIGWSMVFAIVFFSAVFIATPALVSKLGGRALGVDSDLWQNILEGGVRIGIFVGYILLISLIPDIKRVFQYHGAEHKTIYAYENDDPFEPEVVDRYTTLHVRCGTNFLFIVMFLTIIGHFLGDLGLQGQPIVWKIVARILMIPLLAGVSYEVIRAAGKNPRSVVFRGASLPGLAMQKITTRPPTRDQIEVAIKAMEAVIARQSAIEALRQPAETQAAASAIPVLDPQPSTAPATPG